MASQTVQVPGIDVVFDDVLPGRRFLNPRYAVSLANVLGRPKVMAEVFGGSGWWVNPETCKFVLGAMAVRGANWPELHAFWSGHATNPEKIPFPPTFDPNNPWWPAMDQIVQWDARVSHLNRGRNTKEVAVLIPNRAVECAMGTPKHLANSADDAFTDIVYGLEDSQVDFDLLTEAFFDADPGMTVSAEVRDGKLIVGNSSYSVLVLPAVDTMSLETIQIARRLAEQGGRVVLMGSGPTNETRGRDKDLSAEIQALAQARSAASGNRSVIRCAGDRELKAVMREQKLPEVVLAPANDKVRVLHRRSENADAYLLFNEGETVFSGVGEFRAKGTPQIWDADSGQVVAAETGRGADGSASVRLRLEPYQFVAVVFQGDGEVAASKWSDFEEFTRSAAPIKLDGRWTLQFDAAGAEARPVELGDWSKISPKFSGTGAYACEFSVPGNIPAGFKWILDLGAVKDVAEWKSMAKRRAGFYGDPTDWTLGSTCNPV